MTNPERPLPLEDPAAIDALGVDLRSVGFDAAGIADLPGPHRAALDAELLVASQFTLFGQTTKVRRPSWSAAAPPAIAEPLVQGVVQSLRRRDADSEHRGLRRRQAGTQRQ